MFAAFENHDGLSQLQQSAFSELLNMDEEFMGAYMQGLLGSDQGLPHLNAARAAAGLGIGASQAQNLAVNDSVWNRPQPSQAPNHHGSVLPVNTTSGPLSLLQNPQQLGFPPASLPSLPSLPSSSGPTSQSPFSIPLHRSSRTNPPLPGPLPSVQYTSPTTSVANGLPTPTNHTPLEAGPSIEFTTLDSEGLTGTQNMDTNSGHSSDPSNLGKKRRVRTPKQQVLNKLAQQRYRERRRQRYDDLERAVDALTEQLGSLQQVQRENRHLSVTNTELRKQLGAQQQELSQMRQQLQASTVAAGICSAAGSAAAKWDYETIRAQLSEMVSALKTKLATNGLEQGPVPQDLRISDALLQDLQEAVGQYCQLCMQLMCADMPHMAGRLAAADIKSLILPHQTSLRTQWEDCIANLNMNKEQKAVLLRMKEQHMGKLRSLYEERQRLNMTAMGLMLPHPFQGPCCDPTPDGKLQCMKSKGQLFCIGNDLELHKVLDDIKKNLRGEQKALVEFNYLFCHRVLNIAQSARLIVAAYPCNIDALALGIVLEAITEPNELAQLTRAPSNNPDQPAPTAPATTNPDRSTATRAPGCCDNDTTCCPPPSASNNPAPLPQQPPHAVAAAQRMAAAGAASNSSDSIQCCSSNNHSQSPTSSTQPCSCFPGKCGPECSVCGCKGAPRTAVGQLPANVTLPMVYDCC